MPMGKGYNYSGSSMGRGHKHGSKSMRAHMHGYSERSSERYSMSMGSGIMGHDKSPKEINAFRSQKRDLGRMQVRPMEYRGYPDAAFAYEY